VHEKKQESEDISKISEKSLIHGMMFSTIASAEISSLAINTSLSTLSRVGEGQYMNVTIQAVSETFGVPYYTKGRPKDYSCLTGVFCSYKIIMQDISISSFSESAPS